jgi:hypothetical protein
LVVARPGQGKVVDVAAGELSFRLQKILQCLASLHGGDFSRATESAVPALGGPQNVDYNPTGTVGALTYWALDSILDYLKSPAHRDAG